MPRRFPCASRIYRILGAHGTGIHEEDRVDEMATDYDAPRRTESDEVSEDSLEELKARRNEAQSAVVDIDETDTAESFELPGADLSGEELSVRVVPKQADEFTCSSCFLVHHRSRLASDANGQLVWTALPDLPSRWSTRQREGRPRVGKYCFAVTALVRDPAQPADQRDDVCSPTSTAWDPPGRRARSTPLS